VGITKEQKAQAAVWRADEVCHADQMTVWSDEVAAALEPFIRDPLPYDEVVALHLTLQEEIRRVIKTAFLMSEST
jgi:hypothetical protein